MILIVIANYWFFIPLVILVVVLFFTIRYYLAASVEIRRIEALSMCYCLFQSHVTYYELFNLLFGSSRVTFSVEFLNPSTLIWIFVNILFPLINTLVDNAESKINLHHQSSPIEEWKFINDLARWFICSLFQREVPFCPTYQLQYLDWRLFAQINRSVFWFLNGNEGIAEIFDTRHPKRGILQSF